MKTVPLHGKKAAGRVALVDDEDYELVSQYRWRIYERTEPYQQGPYAKTDHWEDGQKRGLRMHVLIMGRRYIDHIDHDGLNNQRSNLRDATSRQNVQNARKRIRAGSPYKGVSWVRKRNMWAARIVADGQSIWLLFSPSDQECAYAYDAAARKHFGEFACTNFPGTAPAALAGQWRAEREAAAEAATAKSATALAAGREAFWGQRESRTLTCEVCGGEFATKAIMAAVRYCGPNCCATAGRRRRKEQQQDGRLF